LQLNYSPKLIPVDQKLIVTITEHRSFGYLLYPYIVEREENDSFLRIVHRVREHHLKKDDYNYSTIESQIVRLAERYSDENLLKKFIPKGTMSDFSRIVKTDDFNIKIKPYIQERLIKCLDLVKGSSIPVYLKKAKYSNLYEEDRIEICSEDTGAVFNFHRTEVDTRYFLTIRHGEEQLLLLHKSIVILVNEPCRILCQNKLYFFNDISGNKLVPFHDKEYISIPRKVEEKYFSTFIMNAVANQEVNYSGFTIIESAPQKSAIISLEIDVLSEPVFMLSFKYDDQVISARNEEKRVVGLVEEGDEFIFKRLSRDFNWENTLLHILNKLGLVGPKYALKLPKELLDNQLNPIYPAVKWLSDNQTELAGDGFTIVQKQLDQNYFIGKQELEIMVRDAHDWFDIYAMVRFGEFTFPFVRLRKNILGGIREFKLPNGKIAILPEEWFARFREIMSFGKADEQRIRLKPGYFMLLMESGLEIDPELRKKVDEMSSTSLSGQSLPEGLHATLRNYQKEGYDWMYHLYSYGLGGCLADDMGLGKTLQSLTLLLKLKRKSSNQLFFDNDGTGQLSLFGNELQPVEERQPATLIILPVSLVHNWENEIRKFASSLKVFCYTGARRKENSRLSGIIDYYDIILTTYGTARNDADILSEHEFFYIILDEGQNIKNPESKTYHAITRLRSKYRLILTGTPIENSLSDLWAQINFLNRGHLGSLTFFKQQFLVPIEQNQDEEMSKKLHQLIRPFILRRTKEQVAKDLPPLTEETLNIEMTPEQKVFYETEKSAVRNLLLENLREEGIKKSAFVVLQALTRLRQIAIHPRLIDPDSEIESGKFNEMLDMMKILVAENHKILVFSSFVKHLNLLSEEFQKMSWGYSMLIGKTTDRKSVIDDFQSNPGKNIFLISLKAGGVGLNLTSADYIFIVDPWWNPAAEMQAVSRAHRIGQDKKVFVYRFISEETIEEKIQILKEKKSALAAEFINKENPLNYITKEDVIQLLD
jgi:superfamily II DNA or RNA helicase